MKRCSVCGETKLLDQFYRRPAMRDGRKSECAECCRANARAYHATHTEQARVSNNHWREENREHNLRRIRAWYAANREHALDYAHQRYMADPDAGRAKGRAVHAKHRDRALAYSRAYYTRFTAEMRARHAAWNRANRAHVAEYSRRWAATHPERHKINMANYSSRRRSRLAAAGVEQLDLAAIVEREKMMCHICGLVIAPDDLSFDHLVPVSAGGPHASWNLALAHRRCNSRRGAGRIPGQLRMPLT